MQRIDKKCLFNVVLGISLVGLISAGVLLFSNFFQIVQGEVPSSYDWPVASLILSGLFVAGALILFALRLFQPNNRPIKAAGILVDFISFLLMLIFMLTLISTDTVKATIQTLILNAAVPFALIIGLVDFHDVKDFITIDVTQKKQDEENKNDESEETDKSIDENENESEEKQVDDNTQEIENENVDSTQENQ